MNYQIVIEVDAESDDEAAVAMARARNSISPTVVTSCELHREINFPMWERVSEITIRRAG